VRPEVAAVLVYVMLTGTPKLTFTVRAHFVNIVAAVLLLVDLRIPVMSSSRSGRSRPVDPEQAGHRVRGMVSSRSEATLAVV
jgi:hypothetical protein